jgi:hypothetical protein
VDLPSGDPAKQEYAANPVKFNEDMEGKFRELISSLPLFSERGEEIISQMKRLEHAETLVPLMVHLRP